MEATPGRGLREQAWLDASGLSHHLGLAGVGPVKLEDPFMPWKKPKIVEVSLALEINSYASAEIG